MDVRFSITIRQRASLRDLIEAIPEEDWTPIPYWMDGAADVAETTYTPFQAEADAAVLGQQWTFEAIPRSRDPSSASIPSAAAVLGQQWTFEAIRPGSTSSGPRSAGASRPGGPSRCHV